MGHDERCQKKQPEGLREWAKRTEWARLVENRRLVRRSGVESGPRREKGPACQGEAK